MSVNLAFLIEYTEDVIQTYSPYFRPVLLNVPRHARGRAFAGAKRLVESCRAVLEDTATDEEVAELARAVIEVWAKKKETREKYCTMVNVAFNAAKILNEIMLAKAQAKQAMLCPRTDEGLVEMICERRT